MNKTQRVVLLLFVLFILIAVYGILNPTHRINYVCIDNVKHFTVTNLVTDNNTTPIIKRDWMGTPIKCNY